MGLILGLAVATAFAAEPARVSETLPVLPWEFKPPPDLEVHLAAVAMSEDDAPVTVEVADGPRPMLLVLMSLTPVEWRITGAAGRLRSVVMVEGGRSLLIGLPANVPAFRNDPRRGFRSPMRPKGLCSPSLTVSPGGQCLDPQLRITSEHVAAARHALTFDRFAFSSLEIGWRSSRLNVPGVPEETPLAVEEAARRLARLASEQPEPAPAAVPAERLARLGARPMPDMAERSAVEFHVVEVGPCLVDRPCPDKVTVTVPSEGPRVIVGLRANRDVDWTVEVEADGRLSGVLLLGGVPPRGLQIPATTPVGVLLDDLLVEVRPIAWLLNPPFPETPGDKQGWRRFERYLPVGDAVRLR